MARVAPPDRVPLLLKLQLATNTPAESRKHSPPPSRVAELPKNAQLDIETQQEKRVDKQAPPPLPWPFSAMPVAWFSMKLQRSMVPWEAMKSRIKNIPPPSGAELLERVQPVKLTIMN